MNDLLLNQKEPKPSTGLTELELFLSERNTNTDPPSSKYMKQASVGMAGDDVQYTSPSLKGCFRSPETFPIEELMAETTLPWFSQMKSLSFAGIMFSSSRVAPARFLTISRNCPQEGKYHSVAFSGAGTISL